MANTPNEIKYCSRCVIPETAESLFLDEAGVCSVCHQIKKKDSELDWVGRKNDLHRLVDSYKDKYDYDCLVPFSGGKDSTFTLWYIVKKLKLKPLVVRFDHGFLRPKVLENTERTIKRLGVDQIHFTPNWNVVRKLMFESLVRRGDFCWHCHTGIFAYPMWVAIRQNIPLIFWGEPGAEYSSFADYDELEEVDDRFFQRRVNLGINAEDMLEMLDNTISDFPVTKRDLLPFTYPPVSELRRIGIKSVYLGSYIPWDVRKQVAIIKDDLGWEGDWVEGIPLDYDYEKIECFMQGVRDYIKFLKRGFGRTAHLASIDIRNGRLTRSEGIDLVQAYDGRKPAALTRFLEILEISEEQFMEIVSKHTVYPREVPDPEEIPESENEPPDFKKLDESIKAWKD